MSIGEGFFVCWNFSVDELILDFGLEFVVVVEVLVVKRVKCCGVVLVENRLVELFVR